MTPEQLAALLSAAAAVLGGIAAVLVQVRQTHSLVNSRMTQLLDLTQRASLSEGRLAQREDDAALTNVAVEPGQDALLQGEPGGPLTNH